MAMHPIMHLLHTQYSLENAWETVNVVIITFQEKQGDINDVLTTTIPVIKTIICVYGIYENITIILCFFHLRRLLHHRASGDEGQAGEIDR